MKQHNRSISDKVIDKLCSTFQKRLEKIRTTPIRIYGKVLPSTSVSEKNHTWRYVTPTREAWIRAKTMFTKEPKTIEWLDNMPLNQTFWDIGASVGCFSLYAARARNALVVSFEPSSNTYAVLSENIHANQLGSQISPFCIAFSDKTTIGYLYLTSRVAGTSEHRIEYHQNVSVSDRPVESRQSSLSYTIDDFIEHFNMQVPNYIKIDVDGNENKILSGARNTLRHPSLRSILIEIDEKDRESARDAIQALSAEKFQIATKAPLKKGIENTMFNYVFSRSA
jgi:FkbM family methyltransferase